MHIRTFRPGDEQALHAVFHSAIHGIAIRDYSAEQVEAWAPSPVTEEMWERWKARMAGIQPFIVETASGIAAYGDLQADGYIDHFFVSADFARQGVGSFLMSHLLHEAELRQIRHLTSNVSLTAQPFFQRFGFQIVERRIVTVRGVSMPNALMAR